MTTPRQAIKPRKAPVQARSHATVEAILEAAARILETDGLAALNTNAVAARAGVSVGSLYQYFPSKEAVLSALLQRERQMMCDQLREGVAASGGVPLEAAVRALLDIGAAHQLERPALARQLEYVEATLPVEAQTQGMNAEIADLLASFLHARGLARAELAARDIAAMTRGMIDAAGQAGETDRAALVERLQPAVMGYMAALDS